MFAAVLDGGSSPQLIQTHIDQNITITWRTNAPVSDAFVRLTKYDLSSDSFLVMYVKDAIDAHAQPLGLKKGDEARISLVLSDKEVGLDISMINPGDAGFYKLEVRPRGDGSDKVGLAALNVDSEKQPPMPTPHPKGKHI